MKTDDKDDDTFWAEVDTLENQIRGIRRKLDDPNLNVKKQNRLRAQIQKLEVALGEIITYAW